MLKIFAKIKNSLCKAIQQLMKTCFSNYYQQPHKDVYLQIATLYVIGYNNKYGTLATSFIAFLVFHLFAYITPSLQVIAMTLALIIGFFVSEKVYLEHNNQIGYVVFDKACGVGISLLLVAQDTLLSVIATVIFTLISITNPGFIKQLSSIFKRGTKIMIDDILIGFLTLIITIIISVFIA